jgi:SepF-like predicted cell division protein (DUF552 family)
MKFSLFRKQKQQSNPEQPAAPPQEKPKEEVELEETEQEAAAPLELTPVESAPVQETVAATQEKKLETVEPLSKTYLKAMPLKTIADVESVKNEVKNGNIIILRITPLASRSIDDVKNAVNDLTQFAESIGGDIARLGEERVVICPKNIRIWREKTPAPTNLLPTAAPTAA